MLMEVKKDYKNAIISQVHVYVCEYIWYTKWQEFSKWIATES